MKAPNKIYIPFYPNYDGIDTHLSDEWFEGKAIDHVEGWKEYIHKDALMEWVEKEIERLYELLPDADNPNPTQMELRYLGQYMQMEALEDKLKSM